MYTDHTNKVASWNYRYYISAMDANTRKGVTGNHFVWTLQQLELYMQNYSNIKPINIKPNHRAEINALLPPSVIIS